MSLADNVDEALFVADEMGRLDEVDARAAGAPRSEGDRPLLDRLSLRSGRSISSTRRSGGAGWRWCIGPPTSRLNRRVAIKVLPPELAFNADVRERFLREAQTSAQLVASEHRPHLHGG